jgi:hypothetical protein
MLTTRLRLKKSLRHRHGGNLSVTAITSAQIHRCYMRGRANAATIVLAPWQRSRPLAHAQQHGTPVWQHQSQARLLSGPRLMKSRRRATDVPPISRRSSRFPRPRITATFNVAVSTAKTSTTGSTPSARSGRATKRRLEPRSRRQAADLARVEPFFARFAILRQRQNPTRTSPTTCRFRMSPKMCCWTC